jgi:hypothetical protein
VEAAQALIAQLAETGTEGEIEGPGGNQSPPDPAADTP